MSALSLNKRFHQVPLGDVELELDRLWREVNESALAAGEAAVSRNMVHTLVTYTAKPEDAQVALTSVEELASQHPSRSIILLPEPDAPEATIDTHVAVHYVRSGTSEGYGEEIVVEARGDAARHVPGAVLPLLITGLPAFLWWGGEPPWGSPLIETLVDGSDRLIVDSCEWIDPEVGLASAADLMRRKHTHCALSDFNWTRQTPWRELTAQFFDSPTLRPYLQGIDRVTVEYAAGEEEGATNPAQAYLFVGWLASRLGWSPQTSYRRGFGPARQHTLHTQSGRPVLVEVNARFGLPTECWADIDRQARKRALVAGQVGAPGGGVMEPVDAAIGHGALMSVRIHAVADRQPGTFIVARGQDLQLATTLSQVDSGAPPSHTVHLGSIGETALLHGQLELLGHDAIYEDALLSAARLTGYEPRRMSV